MSSDGHQECRRTEGTAAKARFCCEDLQTQADLPPSSPQRRLNLGYQWQAFNVLNEAPKSVAVYENGGRNAYAGSVQCQEGQRQVFSLHPLVCGGG